MNTVHAFWQNSPGGCEPHSQMTRGIDTLSAITIRRPGRCTHAPTASLRAVVFTLACGIAGLAPLSAEETVTLAQCLQDDSARLGLRACSALLQGSELQVEDRAKAYAARGKAWLREEEPDEAVADFTRALEGKPPDPAILALRARAYSQLGDHKAAAQDWSQIAALNPERHEPYLKRAESLLAAGDTAGALADYDRVLGLDAGSTEARIGRGNVFAALNDKDKAYKEFDLAQAARPDDWRVYHARGTAADRWGDTKLAIENYSRTLRLNTVNWDARRALRRMGIINVP